MVQSPAGRSTDRNAAVTDVCGKGCNEKRYLQNVYTVYADGRWIEALPLTVSVTGKMTT